jgi:hypothetical protein
MPAGEWGTILGGVRLLIFLHDLLHSLISPVGRLLCVSWHFNNKIITVIAGLILYRIRVGSELKVYNIMKRNS